MTGMALLAFAAVLIAMAAQQKTNEPVQTARLVAEKKAKTGVNCTPETNKNCWILTPEKLQQIKNFQDGLQRKKDR